MDSAESNSREGTSMSFRKFMDKEINCGYVSMPKLDLKDIVYDNACLDEPKAYTIVICGDSKPPFNMKPMVFDGDVREEFVKWAKDNGLVKMSSGKELFLTDSPSSFLPKISKIVSGAQTGADRGGLDAAIELGIPYGGYIPAGRLAEDGKIPPKYTGFEETRSSSYLVRTRLNTRNSNATVIFTFGPLSGGSQKTKQFCMEADKPCLHIDLKSKGDHEWVFLDWLSSLSGDEDIVLNVAGQRESKAHGIQKAVKEFMAKVLKTANGVD